MYARVGNRPDAEDLTAQVFMRAVEQLDVDRPAAQISAWLYRVAQNAVADYWRAFYRLPQKAYPIDLPPLVRPKVKLSGDDVLVWTASAPEPRLGPYHPWCYIDAS